METLLSLIVENAHYAHWLIFGLFMLAGLNFPLSEDFLIIGSGVVASTIIPENTWKIFLAVFLGAYLSDWMAYWIGRKLGPNLWKFKWFSKMVSKKKIASIEGYYNKYGVLTLLVGRFIPFGMRNALFLTAGLGKMNFIKFIISDGIACFISNSTLFLLSIYFGKNYKTLIANLRIVNLVLIGFFVIALILFLWYKKKKYSTNKSA